MGSYLVTSGDYVWHHGDKTFCFDLDGLYEGRFVYRNLRDARMRREALSVKNPTVAVERREDYMKRRGLA